VAPTPNLRQLFCRGLSVYGGRAYVTGSKWSMRLRMEWLRKRNLRTAISVDFLLFLFFS